MSGFTAGLFSLAGTIVGLALITTLITNSNGTSTVVKAVTGGFSSVLSTAMGSSNIGSIGGGLA